MGYLPQYTPRCRIASLEQLVLGLFGFVWVWVPPAGVALAGGFILPHNRARLPYSGMNDGRA
jgi:hypothetical protein